MSLSHPNLHGFVQSAAEHLCLLLLNCILGLFGNKLQVFIIYPVHLLSLSSFPASLGSLINATSKVSETNYYKNIASGSIEKSGWHKAFLIPCSA